MGDGFQDRRFGHGVEHHALDRHLAQHMLLLEHFQDVPGDGLAFAVGVGGQDQLVGALHGAGDVLDLGLGAGIDVPGHGEIVVRLHRAVLGGQVADMAEAGQHLIAAAQILIDGLGLGGGFDDEDVHAGCFWTFGGLIWGRGAGGQGWEPRNRAFFGKCGGTLMEARTSLSTSRPAVWIKLMVEYDRIYATE